MSKTVLLTLCLSILLLPIFSYGAENARIKITLYEVPTKPEIEIQIHISWGARLPLIPPSYLKTYNTNRSAGRPTGTIEFKTDTMQVDPKVTSFILYGLIRARSGEIIRVIPAKFFDINSKSLNQLEVEITPRRSFNEAFLDSYPLEFQADRGFLNSENVRPTLRSLRHMIDYSGEIDSDVSADVWNRVHTFFKVNRSFFKKGGSDELSEVLQYLRTYTAASRSSEVALFYAEFLNELVTSIKGLEVFDNEDLTDYIYGQLMQLYENRLRECFVQAAISLQKFNEIDEFEKCLILANKILKALRGKFLLDLIENESSNLFSVLLQTTVCGQNYYQEYSKIPGASRFRSNAGARYLSTSEVGRAMIREYVRVCDVMISKDLLSLRSKGRAYQIAKFYMAYNSALEGEF